MTHSLTADLLIEYLAGDLDDETRERIDLQRQIVGSPVHKWFEEMQQKLGDPFNVDWSALAVDSDEIEQVESEHKESISHGNINVLSSLHEAHETVGANNELPPMATKVADLAFTPEVPPLVVVHGGNWYQIFGRKSATCRVASGDKWEFLFDGLW
jgi:hypothetical protein